MLLGKRTRQPIKRTTSMTEFTLDLNNVVVEQQQPSAPLKTVGGMMDQRLSPLPRSNRRSSADFTETASFLKSCFLCKRRLIPGRDIYIYRGESAFCSLECRQQQMTQDERKEKYALMSKKEAASVSAAAGPVSGMGEIVAAGM